MSKDLEAYQDAVWDFVLEHCDVTDRGSYFVKFHTTNRSDLEKRIRARAKYNYHREDPRTGETHEQKELRATTRKEQHRVSKRMRRERWKAGTQERKRKLEAVKRQNERRRRWGKLSPVIEYIHNLYTTLTHRN